MIVFTCKLLNFIFKESQTLCNKLLIPPDFKNAYFKSLNLIIIKSEKISPEYEKYIKQLFSNIQRYYSKNKPHKKIYGLKYLNNPKD